MYLDLRQSKPESTTRRILKYKKELEKQKWFPCVGEENVDNKSIFVTQLTENLFFVEYNGSKIRRVLQGEIVEEKIPSDGI